MRDFTEARGRQAVAASILAAVLLGVYFVASVGDLGAFPAVYAVHAVVLGLAFWFPAMKIGRPRDLLRTWPSLLPWMLGWTLVWDLATAGLVGGRELFESWWVVYPAGVLLLAVLLLIHAAAVRRWKRRGTTP